MNCYYLSPAIDGRVILFAFTATGKDERIGPLAAVRKAVANLRSRGFVRMLGIPYKAS